MVKHIIEQHHGTIALTSREHFGTKIVVTLPLYQVDNPERIRQSRKRHDERM
jgi:Signal transduction histidine kinase